MRTILTILREVRDPRDFKARHALGAILFIALAASLCGAKTCVDYADFGLSYEAELGEIVDLPHGSPSHDCFSRIFRLLDSAELTVALTRFSQAMRESLGLGVPAGVIAVDGKRLRRGYERGGAFMPPLMVPALDGERVGCRDAGLDHCVPCAWWQRGRRDAGLAQGARAQRLHCDG